MNQQDKEFLIWIAKRLVYKYKESTDIVQVVQNIVDRYSLEHSIYYDMCHNVYKNITQVINDLSEINTDFLNNINNNQKQLVNTNIYPINSIFDNIDFDKIINKP